MSDNKCLNCIFKSNAVSVLNNEELCILDSGCTVTQFKKGELIFKEGSPVHSINYVREGYIKLFKNVAGNKEFILSIEKKGAFLGIQNLIRLNQNNYFSSVALTPTEVCFIDIKNFSNLLKENGVFANEVIRYILNNDMNFFERLVNNVQQQLPGRLAAALLYFKNEVYNKNPFDINLTKVELASLIGTSRESVSRILKEFQDSGIIAMKKNEIEILNQPKLMEIKQKG
jgi:CRP/FNR family transcriptional regulator